MDNKLFKSDDFIIYQEGGSIKSLNMKLSVDHKKLSKLSVPLPLNLLTSNNYMTGGGIGENILSKNENKEDEVSLIEESLYDDLLKLASENSKRLNKTKKRKLYIKKKSNKRNTRKMH